MTEWMDGWMVELMAMAIAMAMCQHCSYYSINYKITTASILAATAGIAAYSNAAVHPLLGY